jgi:hypothetical protein
VHRVVHCDWTVQNLLSEYLGDEGTHPLDVFELIAGVTTRSEVFPQPVLGTLSPTTPMLIDVVQLPKRIKSDGGMHSPLKIATTQSLRFLS